MRMPASLNASTERRRSSPCISRSSKPRSSRCATARLTATLSIAVAARTAMDKVAVSRAVAHLLERGLLLREMHGDDRRRSVLTLSEAGIRIYDEIVPLALGRERKLLATLDAEERRQLERILEKLANEGLPAMLE